MGMASGLQSQLGFKAESTYGTFVAPDKFVEFNSESFMLEIERLESKGIRAGRRSLHRWSPSIQRVKGGFTQELVPQTAGLLWKHGLGASSTSGTGPYTHTITPGTLDDKSLTVQINRPDISGTNRIFSYLGCVITDWSISASVNDYVMATINMYGQGEDTAQTLATASYSATYTPFTFAQATLTLAGSGYDVKSFSLQGQNGLKDDRHQISATTPTKPKKPLEASLREYTGTISSDFVDLTAYNRFVNGTEAALVLTFTSGTHSMTITTNVRFDGTTPVVSGQDLLDLELPFKCLSSTSDAAAITIVIVNGDATL